MRCAALILALLILATGGIPAAVGQFDAGPTASPAAALPSSTAPVAQVENDPVQTEIIISVEPDGNATWKVVTRHGLQSESDVRAFNQLVDEHQRGEANSTLDEGMFRNYAALAEESTGRSMAVRDVSYTGEVVDDNSTGVLTMSFTWTNFAKQSDGELVVEDVFTTPDGGTWFPWLAEGQRLVIETPEGYDATSTQLGLNRGDVVVEGPRSLRGLYVVYEPVGGSTTPPVPDLGEFPTSLLAGLGVAVVLVVAGVWYLRQQEDGLPSHDGGPTTAGDVGTSGAGTAPATAETPEPDEPAGDEPDVDLSLLSDEERVEYILKQRGGRMRQADIVKETGWSDAKVSQLLSSMADAERINKLRIGRENLISLPDQGVRDDDE